ncbi:MAG: hypothetical protein WCR17_01255 [Candidatus Methanomethylophilaceae archaeon]|jgi:hypothetical protein
MADNKVAMYAAVGLVVGILIGAGVGYVLFHSSGSDNNETYWFYLNFGESNAENGWYSGDATNATDGFDAAMDKAGFEYEVSSYGYIGTIDGVGTSGWYLCSYSYSETSEDAAEASILYASVSFGTLTYSNGWKSFSGYGIDDSGLKLFESNSTIFYFSVYNSDWSASSPVSDTEWMAGGPFVSA